MKAEKSLPSADFRPWQWRIDMRWQSQTGEFFSAMEEARKVRVPPLDMNSRRDK
jgi:hypothetical protein